ncbi:MAG: lipopolysaccharide heptosyltransferase II [Zetaproteobacteria bacterium CG12_big_fil_rev_8_21_14_0_65_54_13]|nr:MAG: lipopolysaccharide heptosyltransferase II [Zetaproteobacteria bacterium CG23_combo_of_CG06-09_8_20_14_all_54_7]PIW44876.1 MAG: lipopolysaccharide heptosyltransferase II [Zetaproteobacteria bacterium CG12_big_fil_rev_8_21_14_0_65_54_13]PJA28225.1 MAG: lipopolysaccharide heptosyltransferase II [Zetaproteobacteria bacterium CG_4_9_14_3_um_filter_54_145]
MSAVNHILLMPPNWIGDAVMAQPAMRAITDHYRAHQPSVRISVCGRGWLQELLPWLNLPQAAYADSIVKADAAFLFPNSFRAAWQCRMAGNRHITGYRGQWRRLLLSTALKHRLSLRYQHHRDFYLDIPTSLGMEVTERHVRLTAPAGAIDNGREAMLAHGLDPQRVIALAPGAQFGAAKCYPEAGFASVCHTLAKAGWQPLILGMPEDKITGERILAGLHTAHWNAAGETTLAQALELIAASQLMLCNDSGLMHVAAGLGIPTVAPFGATDPARTSPSGEHVRILFQPAACSPCLQRECHVAGHPCMTNITPQMLSDACLDLLAA